MLEPPASARAMTVTYPLTADGNEEGFFMGLETYQRRMLFTVPLGQAFEVKDRIPSPIKSPWKFPVLGPSVPHGTICSQ